MPGPPPNGMSSTTRCRSVVWSRRSCTRTSSTPRPAARPTTPSASGACTIAGKMVTMSIFTPGASPRPSLPRLARLAEAPVAIAPDPCPSRRAPPRSSAALSPRLDRDVMFRSSSPSGGSTTIRDAAGSMLSRCWPSSDRISALPLHHEPAALHRSFHRADTAQERIRPVAHLAADQLVMVKRALRQRVRPLLPAADSSAPARLSASSIDSIPSSSRIGRP